MRDLHAEPKEANKLRFDKHEIFMLNQKRRINYDLINMRSSCRNKRGE